MKYRISSHSMHSISITNVVVRSRKDEKAAAAVALLYVVCIKSSCPSRLAASPAASLVIDLFVAQGRRRIKE